MQQGAYGQGLHGDLESDYIHELPTQHQRVVTELPPVGRYVDQGEGASAGDEQLPVAMVITTEGECDAETNKLVNEHTESLHSVVIDQEHTVQSDSGEENSNYKSKSLLDAYMFGIPFGFLGAHHFYLGRHKWGILYLCTLGCLGFGWVIDILFRMPFLVHKCNEKLKKGQSTNQFVDHADNCARVGDGYALWLLGIFGAHQWYLGRKWHGIIYLCTLGGFVTPWVFDLFRMPCIATVQTDGKDCELSIIEAYTFLLPGGIFGLHHFYLSNTKRGVLYLCTLGFFGLGVVVDLFRLPCLVKEARLRKAAELASGNPKQGCCCC